jgi:D-threo-aldose 1-dehydrogenase
VRYDPGARRQLGSAPLEVTCLGRGCGPLGGSHNSRPPPPAVLQRVRAIDALCRRHAVALLAAALRLPLAHGAVRAIIPGALSRAEVLANAGALQVGLPAGLWAELKRERLLHPAAPVPGAA